MADSASHELIIVKRPTEDEHEHHSSAWKVAHADFMTAMMAFFLIMWLINVTDDEVRKGISAYFNPIRLTDGVTDLKGLAKPESGAETTKTPTKPGEVDNVFNPLELSVAHVSQSVHGQSAADGHAAEAGGAAAGGATEDDGGHGKREELHGAGAVDKHDPADSAGATDDFGAATGKPGNGEEDLETAAFQDPYAVLARIAEDYSEGGASTVDVVVGDERKPGVAGGEIDRDPFDPAYWQVAPAFPAVTAVPGKPGTMNDLPEALRIDATALEADVAADGFPSVAVAVLAAEAADGATDDTAAGEAAGPEVEADAGAADVAEADADAADVAEAEADAEAEAKTDAGAEAGSGVVMLDPPEPTVPTDAASTAAPGAPSGEAQAALPADLASETAVDVRTQAVGDRLTAEVATLVRDAVARGEATAAAAENVIVTATGEGVMVNMTDDAGFAMFDVGSAVPNGSVVLMMDRIARLLADKPGAIVVRGHTDARPFRSDTYDNWRLSSARAQMAYYMLVRGGLDERRIVAIEGHADRNLLDPANPFAAENRRIEILLRVVE